MYTIPYYTTWNIYTCEIFVALHSLYSIQFVNINMVFCNGYLCTMNNCKMDKQHESEKKNKQKC